jgi:hypothetical protein
MIKKNAQEADMGWMIGWACGFLCGALVFMSSGTFHMLFGWLM